MTKIIAHRGASGYCPENTLSAFKMAIDQKADGIEIDVHLSKDGYIIVCHDETIDRTTNGYGPIKEMNYSDISKYDAGSWFGKKFADEKIPTLNQVFDLFKNNDMLINIELKAGSMYYQGIEEKVIELINTYGYNDRIIISSFDHYALVKSKELEQNIKTGILYQSNFVDPWEYARKLNADALHPYYRVVNKEFVLQLKANNLMLNPYTINKEEEMKYFASIGVDSIITNYPDVAKSVIV